jgi:hypothetical protein
MTQEDERIARKLLDLSSRSDRVQIRNGMVYLDGYALGNGTVELRSQVVRDRRRRFVSSQEIINAVVLYSVINGAVREFWVKSARFDVKVHEIPLEIELAPPPVLPGPYGYASGTGPVPGGQCPIKYTITIQFQIYDDGRGGLQSLTTKSGNYWGPIGRTFFEITRLQQVGTDLLGRPRYNYRFRVGFFAHGFASRSRLSEQTEMITDWIECPTVTNICYWSAGTDVRFEINPFFVSIVPVNSEQEDNCGSLPALPQPGDPDPEPSTIPNPYEAFLSYFKPKVFTLIKSNLNAEDAEFGALKYQSLIGETLSDLGATADPDDWRGEAVSLTPTAQIESIQPCAADYLASNSGLLKGKKLYSIDLNQDIDGQTLIVRLQNSTDTVTAILIVRTATNDEGGCILGDMQSREVQVPSPGRGEILGIAVDI